MPIPERSMHYCLLGSLILVIMLPLVFSGCASLERSSKYGLTSGRYKYTDESGSRHVQIDAHEDSIIVYDPQTGTTRSFHEHSEQEIQGSIRLRDTSLDLDILTTIFKFRPPTSSLPTQLNTNFNGNVYLGRRVDIYRIRYKPNTVMKMYDRKTDHFGFSAGAFAGIGSTNMAPFTTNNAIDVEYDGLVIQKGVAVVVAVNKLSIGIGLGFDNLMDPNKRTWIYESSIWYGTMLNLNLN